MTGPSLDDYLALFRLYGGDLGRIYLEPADERYRLLFDQVCRLLLKPSDFNLSLPPPFRRTAELYLADDEATVRAMHQPENRQFMLSDLSDFLELKRRMRAEGGQRE